MGVDYNDFVRTTTRIERWEEWLPEWGATAELHMELAREAEDRGIPLSAGEAYVRAAVCFHFSKFVWVVDEGLHRENTLRSLDPLPRAPALLAATPERGE